MVALAAPLGRPLTYLRLVFLLLGAGLAVALSILDATLIVVLARYLDGVALVAAGVLVALAPIAVTLLVPPIRQVEGVAAESLLGTEFPDGAPGPATNGEERVRATTWFLLHVVSGGAAVAAVVAAIEVARFLLGRGVGPGLVAVLMLGLGAAAPFVTGVAMQRIAPMLLGPSHAQRLRRLETETARLVERNRLARELHDSVGHALSVVALQSAGARRRLAADDPEAAATALEAIESTARAATAELDQVLGLLRERADGAADRRPELGLADLDSLVAATRRAGLRVDARVDGSLDGLPGVVSREAYRIVQEGLTNALRHSADASATLLVERRPAALTVTLTNPVGSARGRRGGRGLVGITERARLLGGSATHGHDSGTWRLVVELPLPEPG